MPVKVRGEICLIFIKKGSTPGKQTRYCNEQSDEIKYLTVSVLEVNFCVGSEYLDPKILLSFIIFILKYFLSSFWSILSSCAVQSYPAFVRFTPNLVELIIFHHPNF